MPYEVYQLRAVCPRRLATGAHHYYFKMVTTNLDEVEDMEEYLPENCVCGAKIKVDKKINKGGKWEDQKEDKIGWEIL